MTHIPVDIMLNDGRTFYKTLFYHYMPPMNIDALYVWVLMKLPSLRKRDFSIVFDSPGKNSEPSVYEVKNGRYTKC